MDLHCDVCGKYLGICGDTPLAVVCEHCYENGWRVDEDTVYRDSEYSYYKGISDAMREDDIRTIEPHELFAYGI